MQIPSIPPPLITNPLPQDIATKAVPNTQAVTPLVQHTVDPSKKSEKSHQNRSNKDRSKGGDRGRSDPGQTNTSNDGERGSAVNIDV